MASKLRTFLPAIAVLCTVCFAVQSAHANEACVQNVSLKNYAQKPVMRLQGVDQKRLTLARSLKTYLQNQGRNGALSNAIYKASLKTGVDFELMVLKAKMESDLGRLNVATTSSARGAFQYIEPTWLTLIRRYGDEIGFGHYAAEIERAQYPGVPTIKNNNPYLKAEILALRHDPETSALIKAYQVKEETDVIKNYKRGRKVTATDHYIAHLLGLSLAKEFYKMKNTRSSRSIARHKNASMREAAKLNRAFFYSGKRPLTASESYARIERRVKKEMNAVRNVAYTAQPNIENCEKNFKTALVN